MNAIHRRSIPRSRLFARLLRILLLLAIAMQVYWPPPAHAATTLTVTSTEDSGPGTLRDAIAAATGGDTIDFDGALSGQTITLLSPLLLNKDLTIDGSAIAAPVTLSGGGAVRILEVAEGATVWVLGLVFEVGQASEAEDDEPANQGGAIRNAGTLTLTGCTLTGNRGYRGGAIYNAYTGDLTVSACTLSGNDAVEAGGGIESAGYLALHGSVLSANSVEEGGGALASSSLQENTVAACAFEGNTAVYGGAIGNGGTLTVADSTFVGNTARVGGAIMNLDTLTLANSTLTANVASGMAQMPGLGGGGLANMYTATIRHTTFAGNSAPAGTGGGIVNDAVNAATLDYANTIVAGSEGGDCVQASGPVGPSPEITGNAGNLVQDGSCEAEFSGDPLLGPLADNGGSTQTMALLAGSPAVNAGDADASLPTDQRGATRPQGVAPDIGAYELRAPLAATTGDADAITTMGATLHGAVTAGDRAEVTFEVGTTAAYGATVTPTPAVVTGTAPSTLSVVLEGLDVNTTYHYRVMAANEVGVAHGEDRTFTTDIVAPEAVTGEASDVLATGATLHATVNALGAETTVTFEYGPTTGYGSTVPAAPSTLTGREDTAVSAVLTGLETNQTYHYRVVAVSAGGETRGADRTFIPGQEAPVVVTGAATDVGETGVVLRGTVNALGHDATVAFSYGLTPAYDTTVPAEPQAASGATDVAVMCILSGLEPHTTYHYRVEAESAGGRTEGADATFTIGGVRHEVVVPLLLR